VLSIALPKNPWSAAHHSAPVLAVVVAVLVGGGVRAADELPGEIHEAILAEFYRPEVLTRFDRSPELNELEFMSLDLNEDGTPEYIVEGSYGYCGSGGCSLSIFGKTPSGYRMIANLSGVMTYLTRVPRSLLKTKTGVGA
jgi:hypothetical protein